MVHWPGVIEAIRAQTGWSQKRVASEVGVTQSYISKLKKYRNLNPSDQIRLRFAQILGLSLSDLYETFAPPGHPQEPSGNLQGLAPLPEILLHTVADDAAADQLHARILELEEYIRQTHAEKAQVEQLRGQLSELESHMEQLHVVLRVFLDIPSAYG